MPRYKKVKRGDALDFPAGLQNDLIDLLSAQQTGNGLAAPLLGSLPQGVVVNIKNTSGSDRARWENMSLSTTLRFALGADGKESVIFDAVAGDPAKPAAILQMPIASDKYGRALIFGYTLARVAAGSVTTLAAKPNASNKLSVDATGTIRLLAAPSASVETVIPVLVGVAGSAGKYSARLMGAWAGHVASCQIYTLDGAGVVYFETANVYDPLGVFATLDTGDWMYCTSQGGKYYGADPGSCPTTSPLIASPPATQPA